MHSRPAEFSPALLHGALTLGALTLPYPPRQGPRWLGQLLRPRATGAPQPARPASPVPSLENHSKGSVHRPPLPSLHGGAWQAVSLL